MAVTHIEFHQAALRTLLHGRNGDVARDLKRRGSRVARRAKDLCPVGETAALKNSIHAEDPTDEGGELSVAVVADEDYAIYVERGTRYMAAQPFLGPALAETSS